MAIFRLDQCPECSDKMLCPVRGKVSSIRCEFVKKMEELVTNLGFTVRK